MAEAQKQQAAAAAAAHEAQRAQQLAEASRGVLADLERALDSREAKLQDSWKALKAQLAHVGDTSGAGLLLHSEQRLKVRWGLAAPRGTQFGLGMGGRLAMRTLLASFVMHWPASGDASMR